MENQLAKNAPLKKAKTVCITGLLSSSKLLLGKSFLSIPETIALN
jgi:hypothetical protein